MLLSQYRMKYVRPPNPSALHLRCFADLESDIGPALPYLNTVLHGHLFFPEPPSLTLKHGGGTLITLTSRQIAINMVQDEAEAERILAWLQKEINTVWERRGEVVPSFEVTVAPRFLDILKLLPRTNCRACGQPTCLVFAVQVCQRTQNLSACRGVAAENREKLQKYLAQFNLA